MKSGVEQQVQYGNTSITFTLIFKERKKLAIHVPPDQSVIVEAPLDADLERIKAEVHKKGGWILKQKRGFINFSYELPPREYVSGETHRYLGRQYRLKVIRVKAAEPEKVKMDRGIIKIHVHDPGELSRKKKILEAWYRIRAKKIFKERLEIWLPHFSRYGITAPELRIRKMKSQWGSCTPEGRITLNLKLIRAPQHLIDYVIVHELCHLVELNHGEGFYKLLSRVMPEWERYRERLNQVEF